MTDTEDRPTIQERYIRATKSSQLGVTEKPGDVDAIIAAGWIEDGLGPMLYRLTCEFDAIKGEHALVARSLNALQQQREATEDLKKAEREMAFGPTKALQHARRIAELEYRIQHEPATDLALILMRMKTLPAARDALGRWAVVKATTGRFMVPDTVVLKLVGRVLQAFLDPNCHGCQGRGFNGGYGAPKVFCRTCKDHSGKARDALGQDAAERLFCKTLLSEMDRKLDEVSRLMARFLSQRGA